MYLMTSRIRQKLTASGRKALFVAIAILPFLVVRITYLLLVEFGSVIFSPILGNWRFQAGMGFAMEVAIMILLIVGRTVMQPLVLGKTGEDLSARGVQGEMPSSEAQTSRL
jgi:hypothetical protein